MIRALTQAYFHLVLHRSGWVGLALLLLLGASVHQAQHFRLDASADSLILEGDEDLAYYREVAGGYGAGEFLVVTYRPQEDLLSDASLNRLKALRDELAALPQVSSVLSILDVPLIDSPRVTLAEITERQRTLMDPDTDRELARREFLTSPLYRELVMNREGTVTAMLVNLQGDAEEAALLERRETLRFKRDREGLSDAEREELEAVSAAYTARNAARQAQTQVLIGEVRAILDRYRDGATIFLGGVPMIASDMIAFVRDDIATFGVAVSLFIILLLALSFRRWHWVVIPTGICLFTVVVMTGLLGFMGWPVTVISSNFVSLMLIITLSLAIHLIVRHRELHAADPAQPQSALLEQTLYSKFKPSLFTALTTMVSFASLVVSDIRPVIDFGLMMTWGVLLAFILMFLLFPVALARIPPGPPPTEGRDVTARINLGLAALVERAPKATWGAFAIAVVLGVAGLSRLTVENRFIDYFHSSTEIYQGMLEIDRELGGTTPLDIIIEAPQSWRAAQQPVDAFEGEDDFFDDYLAEVDGGISASSYWFNSFQIEQVRAIHRYLESLPATGKVLSLATALDMVQMINGDEPLSDFELSVMHRLLPEDVKAALFDPYMSEDGNQLRFSLRIIDSDPDLRRDALLKQIERELVGVVGLEPGQARLTGAMVLYNNVIQSLFASQAATLLVVFAAISLMFWMLFQSFKMALIGVLPTLVAALLVLGVIGGLGIPLDIMTITIAAITIGIGVHDTIHYTHRFKDEVAANGYAGAVARCHASVGRAMFYTTVVVTLGFSILALSNFIPTIYFGLFTGVAMIFALTSNLTLLPLLLMRLRPFPAAAAR